MPKIILQDYTKTLRGKTVLDHIDLTLESGGIYGLAGQNGCGKTMLLRAMAGDDPPPPAQPPWAALGWATGSMRPM